MMLAEPTQKLATERSASSKDRQFIWAIMLVGLALRLHFLFASGFVIDADEAIVGLMAKHINEGASFPLFYYGQHYMGSFEPLLASALFRVTGCSPAALHVVPLLFSVVLIPLVYDLASEIGNRLAARSAAAMMAVPPASLVVWGTKARGGFIEIVFLGSLALLYTLRWVKSETKSSLLTALIWALLGFGWWVNNQVIYFILPIALVMAMQLCRRPISFPTVLRHGSIATLFFFLGGLPFWAYNIQHDFVSFKMFTSAEAGDMLDHIGGLFSIAVPILLGGKRFWETTAAYPGSMWVISLCYGLPIGYVLWTRRRQLGNFLIGRLDRARPVELVTIFCVSCICVFTFSSFGYLYRAPRYLLPLYPGLFALVGVAISALAHRSHRIAVGLLMVILGSNLFSLYHGGVNIPGEPFVANGERVERDHSELINWLDQHNVHWVRTNYWIGYKLAFESCERIRFLVSGEPWHTRIESYKTLAKEVPLESMPLILVPTQAGSIKQALEITGRSFKSERVAGYEVLYGIQGRPPRDPSHRLTALASADPNDDGAHLGVDDDVSTRWGTGVHQRPGQVFRLYFRKPTSLSRLIYHLGAWAHDMPGSLKIDAVLTDDTVVPLLSKESFVQAKELTKFEGEANDDASLDISLNVSGGVKKILLTQLGSHPVFDWSIAEVEVYP